MTLASRVGARIPERLLVMLVSLAYRRFEPAARVGVRRLGQAS
jgi:hypothetical protein